MPEQIARVLDHISDGAVIFDENNKIIYENKQFQSLIAGAKSLSGRSKLVDELRTLCRDKAKTLAHKAIGKRLSSPEMGNFQAYVYLINKSQTGGTRYLALLVPALATMAKSGSAPSLPPLNESFRRLVGKDAGFLQALAVAQKAAPGDLPLLILGESGTGKELLARTIHQVSRRSKGPFVDINCAAIPDTLIESELFGYEHGAFTGARASGKPGLFEEAHRGTLFMDEVGDASLSTQAKLLRVLQEGIFKRVGGRRNIKVDVRVVSATNSNLPDMITERRFREDLFYRLNTITIRLPPLRERREDIPVLVHHFTSQQKRAGARRPVFSPDCLRILMQYHWPGNVRELSSVVDYALTMTDRDRITPEFLPHFLFDVEGAIPEEIPDPAAYATWPVELLNLKEVLAQVERQVIEKALTGSQNRSQAIRLLGLSRRSFYQKLKRYDLG